jgi:hypothetical protein
VLIALAYAVLTVRVYRGASWQVAWVVMAAAIPLFGIGVWSPYPWYFTWPLALALTRWDTWSLRLSIGALFLALATMTFYAY